MRIYYSKIIFVSLFFFSCVSNNKNIQNIQNERSNCLDSHYDLSVKLYKHASKSFQFITNNMSLENDSLIKTLKNIDNIIIYTNPNLEKGTINRFTLNDIESRTHRILLDTVIDNRIRVLNLIYTKSNSETHLGMLVLPKKFDKISDIYKSDCKQSLFIYFNEIPDCFCEWNKEQGFPTIKKGIVFKGTYEYLNQCH